MRRCIGGRGRNFFVPRRVFLTIRLCTGGKGRNFFVPRRVFLTITLYTGGRGRKIGPPQQPHLLIVFFSYICSFFLQHITHPNNTTENTIPATIGRIGAISPVCGVPLPSTTTRLQSTVKVAS